MALTASVQVKTTAALTNTAGLVTATGNLSDTITETITAGTYLYTASVTVATDSVTSYNLDGGTLLDAFGLVVDIDVLMAMVLENTHATNYIHLAVMPAAILKGNTPVVIIPPGGVFTWSYPTGIAIATTFTVAGRNAADDAAAVATWGLTCIGKHV